MELQIPRPFSPRKRGYQRLGMTIVSEELSIATLKRCATNGLSG